VRVRIPAGCVAVQVGEAAEILSGGRLRAALHCVVRPRDRALSRQMFVLFCQPRWGAALRAGEAAGDTGASVRDEGTRDEGDALEERLMRCAGVPPLRERWVEGQSFADFGKATTAAYFGAAGLQRAK